MGAVGLPYSFNNGLWRRLYWKNQCCSSGAQASQSPLCVFKLVLGLLTGPDGPHPNRPEIRGSVRFRLFNKTRMVPLQNSIRVSVRVGYYPRPDRLPENPKTIHMSFNFRMFLSNAKAISPIFLP